MSGSGDGVALTPMPPPARTGLPNLLSAMVLDCMEVKVDVVLDNLGEVCRIRGVCCTRC